MNSRSSGLLTHREREVADLVSRGLSDREIAKRLFISPRTAEWHLEQVRNKLGLGTRAEVAAWAATHPPGERPLTTRLPVRLTTFVGRKADISELERLLGTTRMLSLTGTGGVGKTRLALELADHVLARFSDGVWFVDFAPINDPQLVSHTTCEATGLQVAPSRSAVDVLAQRLGTGHQLLVLDNCEHVVDGCAQLADSLLRACPHLTVLATSRESLHIEGETTWRVAPLATPNRPLEDQPTLLLEFDSVALFMDRALRAAPEGAMAQGQVLAVAEICRRLDGIPLAIEMAAARARMMSPEQILSRLEDRFELLTDGTRLAAGRHQTLAAALEWSYALLTEHERTLFRRLSVFSGGFTLEAAEEVASGPGLSRGRVLDLLFRLVDKSLVYPVPMAGEIRYQMLMTVQEFGRRLLLESGEAESVRNAHLRHFLDLAEQARPKLWERSRSVTTRIELEIDNLRLAMAWARSLHIDLAFRMALALDQFWRMRCRFGDGLNTLADLLRTSGGDPAMRANAVGELALLYWNIGDVESAKIHSREAVRLGRQAAPCNGLARGLAVSGYCAQLSGDVASAKSCYDESTKVAADMRDQHAAFVGRQGLVLIAFQSGDLTAARRAGNDLLELYPVDFDPFAHAYARHLNAWFEFEAGAVEMACAHLEVGLRIAAEFSFKHPGSNMMMLVSQIEAERGRYERSLRLSAAASALRGHFPFGARRTRSGQVWSPEPVSWGLTSETAAALIAEGESMTEADAYEYARHSLSFAD